MQTYSDMQTAASPCSFQQQISVLKRKSACTDGCRRWLIATVLALFVSGCGGGTGNVGSSTGGGNPPPVPPSPDVTLSSDNVAAIIQAAAESVSSPIVVAVVDRPGNVLGVWKRSAAPEMSMGNFNKMVKTADLAVALARTGAFFSNNEAPLTSRTVRFISGIHLPPGVKNQPPADLYGIENTNRGCALSTEAENKGIKPSRSMDDTTGLGIITGKADVTDSDPNAVNPGGLGIYQGNILVGGIGVAGVDADVAEFAAFTGAGAGGGKALGALPNPLPPPGAVFLGGIALPNINTMTRPAGVDPGTFSPSEGTFLVPTSGNGSFAFEGDLVSPQESTSPAPADGGLSAAEVKQIMDNAESTAKQTRAAIRLPPGKRTRMVIAVSDLKGNIIGLHRMPDATVFSIDVAATKARNMVYFNSNLRAAGDLPAVPIGTAVTNRTISFGAQPLFPPGIDDSQPGPFFDDYLYDVDHPCSQGFQPPSTANQSGIVFFPGSAGLFRNGALVAGLGISGDGVDQDDFVTDGGTKGFEAPINIRADQIMIDGVRLPYFKFPRNPTN
jgi:uncharacterized protein GlcG (DUF336 family)